jgi:AraC-like DNA-binding protein
MDTTHRHRNYHIGLFGYAIMLIKALKAVNAPYEKLIDKSLIKNFNLVDPNRYIPIHTLYDFFTNVSNYFETKGFPKNLPKHLRFSNLGDGGKYICSSPRLLTALQKMVKYDSYFCTNQITQIDIHGKNARITSEYIDKPCPGRTFMQSIWLSMVCNMLVQASGKVEPSIKIEIPDKKINLFKNINIKSSIKPEQKFSVIEFNSSIISNKISCSPVPGEKKLFNKLQLQRPPVDLYSKIEHFIEHNKSEYFPTLQEMAELFGVSLSTFKRHLKEENSNYHEITDRWRFVKAVSLLTYSNYSINDISHKLYYSNAANFIRAFKRWSGQTPMKFRMST